MTHKLKTRSNLLCLLVSFFVKSGTVAKVTEVLVHSEHEIISLLMLVQMVSIVVVQVLLKSFGGLLQVVMRDLGVEQMVHHMTISDVVAQVIDSISKSAIHSLKCGSEKIPCVGVVHNGGGAMVLQVSHAHQPPTKNQDGDQIIISHGRDITTANMGVHEVSVGTIDSSAHDALGVLHRGTLLPHSLGGDRNEMRTIRGTQQISSPTKERESSHQLFVFTEESVQSLVSLTNSVLGVPGMRVVLGNVVVVHVVATMGQLPGVKWHKNGTMGDVANDIVHPLILGESTMTAAITRNKTSDINTRYTTLCTTLKKH